MAEPRFPANGGQSTDIVLDTSFKNWFPRKLLDVLNDAAKYGFEHIISWLPDGKSFRVHDPILFTGVIMPRYFQNQTKYKSFQRQLNLYSFKPVTLRRGKCSRGASYHPLFRRDMPDLSYEITRSKARMVSRIQGESTAKVHNEMKVQKKASDSATVSLDGTEDCFLPIESKLVNNSPSSFVDSVYQAAGCVASTMMLPASSMRGQESQKAISTNKKLCCHEIPYNFPSDTADEIIKTFGRKSVDRNIGISGISDG